MSLDVEADEDDDGVALTSMEHPSLAAQVTVASTLTPFARLYMTSESAWYLTRAGEVQEVSEADLYRHTTVPFSYFGTSGSPREGRPMYKLIVFIGYDERQDLAYRTCKESILLNTEADEEELSIRPLKLSTLREKGLYYRAANVDGQGRRTDVIDGQPFSTDFSFSRFLVPILVDRGECPVAEWYMFVDSDFVFTDDIMKLLDEADPTKPISVVKHNYKQEGHETKKMDNQWQTPYNRKLWSSLMLFNNTAWSNTFPENSARNTYNVNFVNTATGSDLHQLKFFADEEIGSLSEAWNFIPSHSEERIPVEKAKAIHYTEGTPLMKNYRNCEYANIFNEYLASALDSMSLNGYEELDN